jgi:hypothetical protein
VEQFEHVFFFERNISGWMKIPIIVWLEKLTKTATSSDMISHKFQSNNKKTLQARKKLIKIQMNTKNEDRTIEIKFINEQN